jgi:dethiobiotin synthetase
VAHLVILIGTGTSVGKTYVAERLLRAIGAGGLRGLGYKPVESGFSGGPDSDIAHLGRASTFHVKPRLASQTFKAPVSPNVAARLEGRQVDLDAVRKEVARGCASEADIFVIELPGGAFSPISDHACGADLARSLPEATTILVSVNRLGVLHDIGATTRACTAMDLSLRAIVLTSSLAQDQSADSNLSELRAITSTPVLPPFPRKPSDSPVAPQDPAVALLRLLRAEISG